MRTDYGRQPKHPLIGLGPSFVFWRIVDWLVPTPDYAAMVKRAKRSVA